MNPLKVLNEDCMYHVLQYLSVREILKCTLISREWNELIGNSPVMSKIWLRFYELPNESEPSKVLLESSRKYTNFKSQFSLPTSLSLVMKKFKWKNVMLRDFTIEYGEFIALMFFLSSTVESLDLWDMEIRCATNPLVCVNFYHLRKLEMNLSQRAVIFTFLGLNPLLKTLTIRNESAKFTMIEREMMESSNIIYEIFKKNKIEILKLLYCEFALKHDIMQGLLLSSNLKMLTVTSDSRLDQHKTTSIHSKQVKEKIITKTSIHDVSIITVQFVDKKCSEN